MQTPNLVILAAGMASRYGSLKQMDQFGPNQETLIEYTIYDAIKAGFGKIIFIIREEFATEFKAIFAPKLEGQIPAEYVYQTTDLEPYGYTHPQNRVKPWGTGHAILVAEQAIGNQPFAVINADDFYGFISFEKAIKYFKENNNTTAYHLMGYRLKNTLSDNGAVSRGICEANAQNLLTTIVEQKQIFTQNSMPYILENNIKTDLNPDSYVSMNFWGFYPNIFPEIKKQFAAFLKNNIEVPNAEFLLTDIAQHIITQKLGTFLIIDTDATWFGITYPQDKPYVEKIINKLVGAQVYPNNLWLTEG